MHIITEYVTGRMKREKSIAVWGGVAVATALLTVFVLFYAISFYSMTHEYGWSRSDVMRRLKESVSLITILILFFAFLLYNLFNISVQKRLKELGVLKSLGASPRDIKKVLRLEALLSSAVPVLIGMACGTAVAFGITRLIHYYNAASASYKNLDGTFAFFKVSFRFNPAAYILVLLASELTVFIAVSFSVKKAARLQPLQLFTEQTAGKKRKLRTAQTYQKELFKNYQKYFAPVSRILMAGYLLVLFFLAVSASLDIINEYSRTYSRYNFKILIPSTDYNADSMDWAALFDTLKHTNGVRQAQRHLRMHALIDLPDSAFSQAFKANTTGKSLRYLNKSRRKNNTYRLSVICYGVEQDAYKACVKSAGAPDTVQALVINQTKKTTYEPNYNPQTIPFFNDSLTAVDFAVLNNDGSEGTHTVPVALLSAIPDEAAVELNLYGQSPFHFIPVIIFPLTVLEPLYNNTLASEKLHCYAAPHLCFTIADEVYAEAAGAITECLKASEKAQQVRFKVYNDEIKHNENINDRYKFIAIFSIIAFIVFLLCVINAYAAISISMHNRKKEIAVALSIGLAQKELKALCLKEALLHCVLPFVKMLPFGVLLLYWYASRWTMFSFGTLLAAINYAILLVYVCIIGISVVAIYLVNLKEYTGTQPAELVARAL